MPSGNSKHLNPAELAATRALIQTPPFDQVRIVTEGADHYAISRNRDQIAKLREVLADCLAGADDVE